MPLITCKTVASDFWGFAYNAPHHPHLELQQEEALCSRCETELKENFLSIYAEGFTQTDHFCLALLKTVDFLLDKKKIKPIQILNAVDLTLRLLDHLQRALDKLQENLPASASDDDYQAPLKSVRAILKTQLLVAKVNGAQAQPNTRESVMACVLKGWALQDHSTSVTAISKSVGKLQAPDFVCGFNGEGEACWYRPRPRNTPRTKKDEVLAGTVTRLHCSLVETLQTSLAALSSISIRAVTTQQQRLTKEMSVGNSCHHNTAELLPPPPSVSASASASTSTSMSTSTSTSTSTSRKRSLDLSDTSGASSATLPPQIIRQLRRKIQAARISSNIDVIHETIAEVYTDVSRLLNRIDAPNTAHINNSNTNNNNDNGATDDDNTNNNTNSNGTNDTNNHTNVTNTNVTNTNVTTTHQSNSVISEVENPCIMQVYRENSVVPRFKTQIQEGWVEERKGSQRPSEEIVLFETKNVRTYNFDEINWKQIFTVFKDLEERHQPLLIEGLELRRVAESDSSRHRKYGVFVKENFRFPARHVLGPYCCEVVFDAEYCKTQELAGALERELGVYEFEWTDKWNLSDNNNLVLKSLLGSGDKNRNMLRYVNDYRAFSDVDVDGDDDDGDDDDDEEDDDDDAAVNACFVEVCEKGWPYAFLVTTKDICGGQEILVNRGKEYWANIRPVQKRQCLRDVNCAKIREVKQDMESLLAVLEHDAENH